MRRYVTPWAMSAVTLLIAVAVFSPLGLQYAMALAAVSAVAVYLYLRAVTRLRSSRAVAADDWRLEVQPERLWLVSPRIFDKMRYVLSDSSTTRTIREDKVYLVTRRHWIFLARQAGAPVLLALIFLVVAAWAGNIDVHVPQASHPKSGAKTPYAVTLPHVITIPWWLPVLMALVCLVAALVMSAEWFFRIVMITNLNVILLRLTPTWLPWLKKPKFPWALSWIEH